jgi:hypothetical protein
MVIKYFGPNDKTGTHMPPYTAADRHWLKMYESRPWGAGTIVTVGPAPRTAGPAAFSTNRQSQPEGSS